MAFRPCIDLRNGRVVQIVGGTLGEAETVVNHVSERSAGEFAKLYRQDGLRGGHVIMLGPGNEAAALEALREYSNGLQVGGGITPDNAYAYLEAGASHVIVTSYLFPDNTLSLSRLRAMEHAVGRDRLVIDISCRLLPDGSYYVATNRWQTITDIALDADLLQFLGRSCIELLVHAADVEGKCQGIDERLVTLLGQWATVPITYAGGAKSIDDIHRVDQLSHGKVDLTIGSALDIFGGALVKYEDAARLGRR